MLLDIKYLSEKYRMLIDIKDLSLLKTTAAVLVSLSFVSNDRHILNVIRSQLLSLHKSFGDFSFTPSVPFQGRGSIAYPKYQAHGLLRLGNSTRTTGSFMRNMVLSTPGKAIHAKTDSGPVVRVAPNELSFIGDRAWDDIYGIQKNGPNFEKSPIFIGAVSPMDGQTGISLAPNEVHTRQRRALAHVFTNTALLQQQDIIRSHVDKFVGKMKKMNTYTTFDMMGDLCFAEPFGCLDQGGATEWSKSVINVFKSASWDQSIRRVAGVNTWLQKLMIPSEAATWRKVHFLNSREKTLRRLADGDREHKDFIYHIVKNKEAKTSLSQTEIILNMVLLISAGTETTASLLTGWTYFICTHPKVYKRLTDEIRGRFNSELDITWETVKDLPYLHATLSEALRLYSPAPANQQRIVPPGGSVIDGHFVPGRTTVAVAPWAAVNSSLNFKYPQEFIPERWLGDERFVNDKLNASQPFSLGPRGCIGKNLSFFEMRIITSRLLWAFDVSLVTTGEHGETNKLWDMNGAGKHMKVYQTWNKPDLWVMLKEVSR
ncbi:Cytochrome P450 monooxygenase protein [Rutstroemia sp. NJR-2017a WRK4]|nr:Cytochrome P450 monooxygenase protein [Rutstroemia sp. NJR-2017a WRK4]